MFLLNLLPVPCAHGRNQESPLGGRAMAPSKILKYCNIYTCSLKCRKFKTSGGSIKFTQNDFN